MFELIGLFLKSFFTEGGWLVFLVGLLIGHFATKE